MIEHYFIRDKLLHFLKFIVKLKLQTITLPIKVDNNRIQHEFLDWGVFIQVWSEYFMRVMMHCRRDTASSGKGNAH